MKLERLLNWDINRPQTANEIENGINIYNLRAQYYSVNNCDANYLPDRVMFNVIYANRSPMNIIYMLCMDRCPACDTYILLLLLFWCFCCCCCSCGRRKGLEFNEPNIQCARKKKQFNTNTRNQQLQQQQPTQ